MGMPARLARFLYLTAWDLLLPEVVEKPLKVVNRFYQCFICADPAERLALLAEAGPLTDAQIEEVVNHLATEWKPLLRGGTLTDAQRALLRQLAQSLHAAGQPGATNDPAKVVRQSLKMEAPKALPPDQREVCRSLVHTALQGAANHGPSPLPGDAPTIPGYTLLRVLGSGAFSTVYLAQESGGTLVALKVMKLADAAQFRREVRTLSQVTGEYLVAYRAHGEIGDRYWIAMHYAGDTTLANLIAGRPSAEVVLPLAEQVLRGLDELHSKGMVHRDLKPENAIVGDDYRLRLIDFGLSKQMEEAGVSTTLGAAGTALYMSPEQIHGQATYASDVWAFGCLLYEMLVGKPLFEGKNIMQVAIEISGRAISVEVPEVPPEVRPFLARCLQRKAVDRYPNATAALADFVNVVAEMRQRLRYERYFRLWGKVLDKRLLEQFAEQHHGQLPPDAPARFLAIVKQEGLPDIDEERLAQILPPIFSSWREVVAAEQAVIAAKQQLHRDVARLSSAELAARAHQLAELEKLPNQRRGQVRQMVEMQLARERSEWSKFKEAEERKRQEAEAAEMKRIADAAVAEERRRMEVAAAAAKRREKAEAEAKRMREGLVSFASLICFPLLLGGIVWAGAGAWQWVTTPVPSASAAPCAPLSQFQQTYAEKSGLRLRKALTYNGVVFNFVLIPPGQFQMGEAGGSTNETPHPVEITQPYFLLTTEVTERMYMAVMGKNSGYVTSDTTIPVESVSWVQANEFCDKLSNALNVKIQLPSEAQWEYACRAGSTTKYPFGDDETQLEDYAWYYENSDLDSLTRRHHIHPVGTRKPNAWGLYDMQGNASEWCSDAYRPDYENLPSQDPHNMGKPKDSRVVRGGSYRTTYEFCRAVSRTPALPAASPMISIAGFRICCMP